MIALPHMLWQSFPVQDRSTSSAADRHRRPQKSGTPQDANDSLAPTCIVQSQESLRRTVESALLLAYVGSKISGLSLKRLYRL